MNTGRSHLIASFRPAVAFTCSRPVAPARELDPSAFTKIDRLADRSINLPEGEYKIFSRQNPAYVTPKGEKDGNTKVKVEVAHLAAPHAVFDEASTYVVWLKPEAGEAQNVGVLNINKDLKGELETRTAVKDFQVIVTAEKDGNATAPGVPMVSVIVSLNG